MLNRVSDTINQYCTRFYEFLDTYNTYKSQIISITPKLLFTFNNYVYLNNLHDTTGKNYYISNRHFVDFTIYDFLPPQYVKRN